MKTYLKSTETPQNKQRSTEHETQSVSREKASTFNVQTGLRAGELRVRPEEAAAFAMLDLGSRIGSFFDRLRA